MPVTPLPLPEGTRQPTAAELEQSFSFDLSRRQIVLNETQWRVARAIFELIASEKTVSQFFVARLTGVSFVFKEIEAFCKKGMFES